VLRPRNRRSAEERGSRLSTGDRVGCAKPPLGSRLVRGGCYAISIDFGLEVIEKANTCREAFKSKFIDLTIKPRLKVRLILTLDRPSCKIPSLKSPISLAPGHAIASATKRFRLTPPKGDDAIILLNHLRFFCRKAASFNAWFRQLLLSR
jgi:hypothetical protein